MRHLLNRVDASGSWCMCPAEIERVARYEPMHCDATTLASLPVARSGLVRKSCCAFRAERPAVLLVYPTHDMLQSPRAGNYP